MQTCGFLPMKMIASDITINYARFSAVTLVRKTTIKSIMTLDMHTNICFRLCHRNVAHHDHAHANATKKNFITS